MRLPATAVRKVEKEITAALPEWPGLDSTEVSLSA
jgi:hypothetical protein